MEGACVLDPTKWGGGGNSWIAERLSRSENLVSWGGEYEGDNCLGYGTVQSSGPEDEGSTCLWNVGMFLRDYMATYSRRLSSSSLRYVLPTSPRVVTTQNYTETFPVGRPSSLAIPFLQVNCKTHIATSHMQLLDRLHAAQTRRKSCRSTRRAWHGPEAKQPRVRGTQHRPLSLHAGPYYPSGSLGTVPKAYEEMGGRKNKKK
jgi:hypothetical protein